MAARTGRRGRREDPPARESAGPAPHPQGPADGSPDVPVPRDFGRDGISGLVSHDRALRAREVSRPRPEDEADAVAGAEAMLRRLGPRRS